MGTKPNVIVYVTRAGLAITGKKLPLARLPLPSDLVNNLEVINVEKLTALCQEFFTNHGLKGKRVLLVLGLSVIFQKTISLDKQGNPAALTKAFVDAMPFEPGRRACLADTEGNQLKIYTTNAVLFEPLVEGARLAKAKVVAVTPASAYRLTGTDKSFEALANQFIKDTHVLKATNFLDAELY